MANSLLHHTKFLASKAQKKQLITFQEFADQFEIKTIRSTTTPLKKVLKWTESKGLPPLNAIVVAEDNANPEYIEQNEDLQQTIESVFDYPWKNIFLNLPDD